MPNEIFMPKLSSTMSEGTLIEWLKDVGDNIEKGEPILEIMTDKINIEVESYHEGVLLKKYFEKDDIVPVNHVVGYIGQEKESVPENPPGESSDASQENNEGIKEETVSNKNKIPTAAEEKSSSMNRIISDTRESDLGKVRATPAARSLARNKDINIKDVEGTGRNGRVHKQDVANHQHSVTSDITSNRPPASTNLEELKGNRKLTADKMADSSATIPHVTIDFEVDMDNLIKLREQVNQNQQNNKISFNDILIFITSKALSKHPDMNITFESDKIHYHEEKNIGLAVAVGKELFVPIIKNTEAKSLLKIRDESKEIISNSRNKKLNPEVMQGGTFTITNLGMYNVKQFNPVINKPQASILGIGGTYDKPTVQNGELFNKKTATFSLSFDHRVINGAPAADFCDTIKHLSENPVELII